MKETKTPKGTYQVKCSDCGFLGALNTDKKQVVLNAKATGWKIATIKKVTGWFCPSCLCKKK